MTAPVIAAQKTVEVVKVVRAFPWFRAFVILLVVLWLFLHYFVMPLFRGLDRLTPWDGMLPFVPIACGAPAAPPAELAGFDAMAHDLGAVVHRLSTGPAPDRAEFVGWFQGAGTSIARTASFLRGGVEGRPRPIPLAPEVPPLAPQQVSAAGPVNTCPPIDVPGAPQVTWANGQMPDAALVRVAGGQRLRADAAAAYGQLAAAFEQANGRPLLLNSGYRSRGEQASLYASHRARGSNLAAPPGKSNHGEGIAADLGSGVQSFGTPQHRWMRANAGRFGWVLPSWAQERGSKPEPWHWEYVGTGQAAG